MHCFRNVYHYLLAKMMDCRCRFAFTPAEWLNGVYLEFTWSTLEWSDQRMAVGIPLVRLATCGDRGLFAIMGAGSLNPGHAFLTGWLHLCTQMPRNVINLNPPASWPSSGSGSSRFNGPLIESRILFGKRPGAVNRLARWVGHFKRPTV